MWPYSWTHVGTPSHLGHMDRVAATRPFQAHAGAAQEAPNIGQWEGQDVPLVRPSSCTVKGGIPSSRRYLPTYLAVGVAEGRPRAGCFPPMRGASEVRHCPSPDCPPTWRAVGVRHPRAVGAGVWVWGPNTVPLAFMPCGGFVPRGWWGGRPRGGWPATVVRGVWCQALSLPRPPVLWSGQQGFRDPCVPGAVGAGVGTHHRPHSVRPCGPALLAVGVAERGSPGGVPSTIVRGVCGQALSLPRLPAHWAGVGVRHPRAVGGGVWVWRPNTVPLA